MTTKKEFYLYGSPISHSPSPLLHNAGFQALSLPYRYSLCETTDIEKVVERLREPNTAGGSVTIPHKQTIMPFLDEISDSAARIGAVNTVVKAEDGRLLGDNTDWLAIHDAVLSKLTHLAASPGSRLELKGKKGLVIGAGGTAHAACYALSQLGLDLYVYNRTLDKAQRLVQRFGGVQALSNLDELLFASPEGKEQQGQSMVEVVIGTVPPTAGFELPEAILQRTRVVVELVYHPRRTPLIQQALKQKENGVRIEVVEGIELLLLQGLCQFRIWTEGKGKQAEEEEERQERAKRVIVQRMLKEYRGGELLENPPSTFLPFVPSSSNE
ncbi:3-dehydroquinate dehydratase (3-dehydroquinase) [Balamuthia mandrillaris]